MNKIKFGVHTRKFKIGTSHRKSDEEKTEKKKKSKKDKRRIRKKKQEEKIQIMTGRDDRVMKK